MHEAGKRADDIDQVVIDIKVISHILNQANLLFDAEAYSQIRQVNDQIKAQMKRNPALAVIFQQVLDVFAAYGAGAASPGGATPEEAPGAPAPVTT